MITAQDLANAATQEYGLPVAPLPSPNSAGAPYRIRTDCLDKHQGFVLELDVQFRSVATRIFPEKFAADLVRSISTAIQDNEHVLRAAVDSTSKAGGSTEFWVDNRKVSCQQLVAGTLPHRSIEVRIRRGGLEPGIDQSRPSDAHVLESFRLAFETMLALLPLDDVEPPTDAFEDSYVEGAASEIRLSRYERSAAARSAALRIHGIRCKACSLSFPDRYGELGRGFIHIHHVVPLSERSKEYRVNPQTDLVPLCPNCHHMVHRQKPPLSVDELRSILESG